MIDCPHYSRLGNFLNGNYCMSHSVKNILEILYEIRPFQVFSMFSVHPGKQNLPTYQEKTNKLRMSTDIRIFVFVPNIRIRFLNSNFRIFFLSLRFLSFFLLFRYFYVPRTEGGGDILFLVRIPSASALLRFRALSFEPMDGF